MKFADAVRAKMLLSTLRKAGEPIRDAAKANVRSKTGTLANSIIMVSRTYGQKGMVCHLLIGIKTKVKVPIRMVTRGPRKGRLRMAIPTLYAQQVEFGHKIVVNGKVVGQVAPRPFMRPAWAQHGGRTALSVIEVELTTQIANWKP
jgi:hypothetical protein